MVKLAAVGSEPKGTMTGKWALPAWVYNHPDMTRLELERVLRPSWQVACHVSSIPNPGDFVSFELGPDSIVVVRDKERQVRAYHNVCRHRGAKLLDGTGHCAGTIVCPYHGWSYSYDGSLIGIPNRETFPGLDRSAHGLKPVKVEVLLGLVFVCVAGDPKPVRETWAPFLEELAPYRIEEMVPLGPVAHEIWEVDWKVAMDNYLESYHVPIGHPGLNRMFTPDYDDQRAMNTIARGTSHVREQPSPKWSERMYQQLVGPTITHLPENKKRSWHFFSMLPNLGVDVYPELMDFFQMLPLGPGRTSIRYAQFVLPDDRREMRVLRKLSNRINNQINVEDRSLCERVQRGLASPSYTPGPLSNIETWMSQFHGLLESAIPELRLPHPPKHFA